MRTIEQMVQQEVNCCMSSLVSTLAQGYGAGIWDGGKAAKAVGDGLPDLIEQAFELASPIPDYEEAAIQNEWRRSDDGEWMKQVSPSTDDYEGDYEFAKTAEQACAQGDIEPYDREVFEHWAVSQWLAEKLLAAGEKVDTDFANLNVWARTCSGQGIASDGVIERIYADMMKA